MADPIAKPKPGSRVAGASTLPAKPPVKPVADAKASPVVKPAAKSSNPVDPKPAKARGRPPSAKAVTPKAAPVAAKPAPTVQAPKPVVAKAAPKPAPAKAPVNPAPEKPVVTQQETAPAPASAQIEGSKQMNEAVKKVEETTRKFTADAGQKVQAMFGEASERAKGAYERGLKIAEEMTEFSKGNVEAVVESSKLAAKGAESLGQEAADYARKSFENSTAAFKTFASAKSPTELFKLQSDYVKSSFDAAVAESSKVTEAWLKLAGEIVQPVSNRFAVAMEKARAVAL